VSSLVSLQKNEGIEAFQGKATLILINTMGFPIVRHVRILKALLHSHELQRQTLQLQYIERRYRRPTGVHFADNEVAIAHGWQHVQGAFNPLIKTPGKFGHWQQSKHWQQPNHLPTKRLKTMKFPTPNHCGLTWDALNQLVARKLGEGTIVGDDGDGWLVAYLEGRWFNDQPDDLIVYFSYAQDSSDWSIGNEDWSNLGWTPNTPRDHHWYEALPHPKQFTDRNSSRVDGIIITYTDRGKRYHYAEVEIAEARKLKPLSDLHELLECYDIIVLKTAAGRESLRWQLQAVIIQSLLTVSNFSFMLLQEETHFEVILRDGHTAKLFSQAIGYEDLTQKAFEEAIAALDRQVQDDRNQSQTKLSYEEWQVKFAEALAQLQPGVTLADLAFTYLNFYLHFYHEGWTPYTAAQALIETHVLRPELGIFTRSFLEPPTP